MWCGFGRQGWRLPIARLTTEGEFEKRAVRPAAGVADLLRVTPSEARRMVSTARAIFPTSLSGAPLEPALPTTASALAAYEIDTAHADVIDRALSTSAARRIGPERRADVETQLADWARTYRPDELAVLARRSIDALDQDGPAPDDDHPQINELHLSTLPGGGGRIKGRLDAPTYEAVARAVRACLAPDTDTDKPLGERQAEALAAICEHALDTGHLPTEAGQRPHITAILDYHRLTEHGHGATLEFGGHHIVHWADGGPTDLDNLVLLCLQHHIMVHESGCRIHMRNGHPELVPPKWIDAEQKPRTRAPMATI